MKAQDIISQLKKEFEEFSPKESRESNIGRIIEVKDGIARISGLNKCMALEILQLPNNTIAVAMNLEENDIGAVIVGDYGHIHEGDVAESTGRVLEMPAGDAFIGRVVDALGGAIDGKGAIRADAMMSVERIAPGVIARKSVYKPLETGIKAIDAMIPIGRGQRELIIGDRQTGRTAIVVDTIINQKAGDVICIYCAIGQKDAKIAKIVDTFEKSGAMGHTIVLNASAASSAALQYLAPYAATALGEYFMQKGRDVLVVYDDLSKHAIAYRQLALLLRRPPGREAYPGDVFYLHSRLLERSACLSPEYGGGSLTALPIIETQAGDVSAYIPTNVISITDGQIYLDPDLFYSGIRPAINVGLSVSRVGSAAQTKAMKSVAGKLRLELAQYWELAAFAQFEADLDEETKKRLNRGKRLVEILKQENLKPMPQSEQALVIFAAINGFADDIPVRDVIKFEKDLIAYVSASRKDIMDELSKGGPVEAELAEKIKAAISDFRAKKSTDE